jgi:hypothetical protein
VQRPAAKPPRKRATQSSALRGLDTIGVGTTASSLVHLNLRVESSTADAIETIMRAENRPLAAVVRSLLLLGLVSYSHLSALLASPFPTPSPSAEAWLMVPEVYDALLEALTPEALRHAKD